MTDQQHVYLTAREQEQARKQVIQAQRDRLQLQKPNEANYSGGNTGASAVIASTLNWAKAITPLIAVFAALASAVRTVQTAAEIYTASGSHPIGVLIAALGFTIGAEAALFIMALAQEGQRLKWRAERRPRQVLTLATIGRAVAVRLGIKEPLRHDEIQNSDGSGIVIIIAFSFAVAANFYLGMRPVLDAIAPTVAGGTVPSLQAFIASLGNAPAPLQVQFIVDLAGVLFPPVMAYASGHLVARWAADIAEESQAVRQAYNDDMTTWRASWADPLATEEGQETLEALLQDKLTAKMARKGVSVLASSAPKAEPLPPAPEVTPEELATIGAPLHSNGNGHSGE